MTNIPLCTNPLCPAPSDPDWHRCICCGRPEGDHAHVESRARNPARKKSKDNIVFLCREHHREVDERQNGVHGHAIRQIPGRGRLYFRWDLHGNTTFEKVLDATGADDSTALPETDTESSVAVGAGVADAKGRPHGSDSPALIMDGEGTAKLGSTIILQAEAVEEKPARHGRAQRAANIALESVSAHMPSPFSLDSDWTALTDDQLQLIYEEGRRRQREGFMTVCKAVWQYRENHVQAWGESWTEQAIERFGCSRRSAESYANLWQIYVTSDAYLQEGMESLLDSRSLMQAIGRKKPEEGARLLEKAVSHVAEFAEPPTVAALLSPATDNPEPAERERCTCRCGNVHWLEVKGEWKG